MMRLEMYFHRESHNVLPGRLTLTMRTTAGVDVELTSLLELILIYENQFVFHVLIILFFYTDHDKKYTPNSLSL